MAKKIALGQGIASLIQNTHSEVVATALRENFSDDKSEKFGDMVALLDINQVKINPNQPRKIFKDKELAELARSIEQNGIIQPLVVSKSEDGFHLIAGERRLRAAKIAQLEKVPVIIKKVTDREKMIMSVIENVQRSDLNCVEEALAYYQLMDDFHLTQEELAKQIGKERSTVANFLRILKLPRTVVEMLQKELMTFGHAKVLASLSDNETVTRLASLTVANKLSVRELENLIKKKPVIRSPVMSSRFDERWDQLRQGLEKNTGFHFGIKSKKNGAGEIIIKFSNEAEFNDIYEYLLKK